MKQFAKPADTSEYFFTASMDTGEGPLDKAKNLSISSVCPDLGDIVDSGLGLS